MHFEEEEADPGVEEDLLEEEEADPGVEEDLFEEEEADPGVEGDLLEKEEADPGIQEDLLEGEEADPGQGGEAGVDVVGLPLLAKSHTEPERIRLHQQALHNNISH